MLWNFTVLTTGMDLFSKTLTLRSMREYMEWTLTSGGAGTCTGKSNTGWRRSVHIEKFQWFFFYEFVMPALSHIYSAASQAAPVGVWYPANHATCGVPSVGGAWMGMECSRWEKWTRLVIKLNTSPDVPSLYCRPWLEETSGRGYIEFCKIAALEWKRWVVLRFWIKCGNIVWLASSPGSACMHEWMPWGRSVVWGLHADEAKIMYHIMMASEGWLITVEFQGSPGWRRVFIVTSGCHTSLGSAVGVAGAPPWPLTHRTTSVYAERDMLEETARKKNDMTKDL